jgi:ubiquinone/menaquinone biosynthesis C-methylase UbiE
MIHTKSLSDEKYNFPADHMKAETPSLFWREIWGRKARILNEAPASFIDGYHFITESQYNELIRLVIEPMGIKAGSSLLECGCGAGAFLYAVKLASDEINLHGVDYSRPMLCAARIRMPFAHYILGDIRDLSALRKETFDHTAAFAVLCYLNNTSEAEQALDEMLRVTRPGGCIFLGDTSDAGKRIEAIKLLKEIWRPCSIPEYLFLEKDFFRRYAESRNLQIRIEDMDRKELSWYPPGKLRYSVYLYKPLNK